VREVVMGQVMFRNQNVENRVSKYDAKSHNN
jgi:hypothetical protein